MLRIHRISPFFCVTKSEECSLTGRCRSPGAGFLKLPSGPGCGSGRGPGQLARTSRRLRGNPGRRRGTLRKKREKIEKKRSSSAGKAPRWLFASQRGGGLELVWSWLVAARPDPPITKPGWNVSVSGAPTPRCFLQLSHTDSHIFWPALDSHSHS